MAGTTIRSAYLIALALGAGCTDGPGSGRVEATSRLVTIAPRRVPCLRIHDEDWRRLANSFIGCLSSKDKHGKEGWITSPSVCLHTLRVMGPGVGLERGIFRNTSELITALTDAQMANKSFGHALLIRTIHGARYRPAAVFAESRTLADENHIDQNLAGLAELGIPLSHPVRIVGWTGTVRDILKDAIANYNVSEPECEWSNIAILLYCAGSGSWTNKYGERFDFEDMATDLLQRPRGRGSCAGLHVLYCVTMLARVQEVRKIVSDATHHDLLRYLKERVETAVARQMENGSWDRTWHVNTAVQVPPTRIHQRAEDVLVTGHLIECLLYMPAAIALPDRVFHRAGRWLLDRVLKASPAEIESEFCPFSHAIVCLRQMRH